MNSNMPEGKKNFLTMISIWGTVRGSFLHYEPRFILNIQEYFIQDKAVFLILKPSAVYFLQEFLCKIDGFP